MTTLSNVVQFAKQDKRHCQSCHLSTLCLPQAFTTEDIEQFSALTRHLAPLHKRDTLFLQGMPFKSLFIIRSGSLKQVTTTANAEAQITHFILPSELLTSPLVPNERVRLSAVS